MSEEKVFVNGMIVKRNDGAPEFVICNLSFKVDEMKAWLDEHCDAGWVNVKINRSQGGKIYAEKDTWKPQGQSSPQPQQAPQYAQQNDASYTHQPVPQHQADPVPSPPDFNTDELDDTCPF